MLAVSTPDTKARGHRNAEQVSWLEFRGAGKPLQFIFDQHMAAGIQRMQGGRQKDGNSCTLKSIFDRWSRCLYKIVNVWEWVCLIGNMTVS